MWPYFLHQGLNEYNLFHFSWSFIDKICTIMNKCFPCTPDHTQFIIELITKVRQYLNFSKILKVNTRCRGKKRKLRKTTTLSLQMYLSSWKSIWMWPYNIYQIINVICKMKWYWICHIQIIEEINCFMDSF